MDTRVEVGLSSAESVELMLAEGPLLERAWPYAAPMLEECEECWNEYHTLDTLYHWIRVGRSQLWMANIGNKFVGLAVTEMRVYPLKLECACVLLCGKGMKELLFPLFARVEEWARMQGATTMYADGRLGWERMLLPLGYERRRTIVQKPLVPSTIN